MSKEQIEKTKIASFLFLSLLLAIQVVSSLKNVIVSNLIQNKQENISIDENAVLRALAYEDINIMAKSVAVYDINTSRFIFEKNSSEVRPIASITKVVSALVSSDEIGENDKIAINKESIGQADDNGLLLGEIWPFKKLLDFSLLVSSNDGAYAIANIAGSISKDNLEEKEQNNPIDVFVQKMNQKSKMIGLENTFFNNPSGLDIDEYEAGGYSSAREIALLMSYVLREKPTLLEATSLATEDFVSDNNIVHSAKNTNAALSSIPALMASKTGYTKLAGGNLAVIYDVGVGKPVVVVVLGSGYSERFSDMSEIVKATNKYFSI